MKVRFGNVCIRLRCTHVKQNGTDCTEFIFLPLADTEQSCTGLLGVKRIGFMQSRINTTPIRFEKGSRYVGDPVSCKQGLKV